MPSIAVLPFGNLSNDPEQENFSDGITEDLITALSRISQFRVVARSSTFSYKGQSPDARQVARELDARYVIEGNVRNANKRIRLTVQLIDGGSGNHIWAEKYDRDLEDIFLLQDELTQTLVGAIEPELLKSEQGIASVKSPELLSAWDAYQRGMWHLHKMKPDDFAAAKSFFERASDLDPGFGPAYSGLALVLFYHGFYGAPRSRKETGDEALAAA
jgi:adenylate cyclase